MWYDYQSRRLATGSKLLAVPAAALGLHLQLAGRMPAAGVKLLVAATTGLALSPTIHRQRVSSGWELLSVPAADFQTSIARRLELNRESAT